MTIEQTQQTVNQYIELTMHQLASKGNAKQFEQIIQQTITTKRTSAHSTQDFWDRLMLNITFFVENKSAWMALMQTTYGVAKLPKPRALENEALAQQMRIRQSITEKMDDYTAIFHDQYKTLEITEDAVIYDYAYASVGHSLRFDFLTFVSSKEDAALLLAGDFDETLRVIDGYIDYYADQYVNQMELN